MTKRVAANYILTERGMLREAMVEITDGVVSSIVELSFLNHEPANTIFINGTLTADNGEPLKIGSRLSL